MTELSCADYSEKAIVVRGEETKTYKEELKELGGKFNAMLKGGPGWIFSKKSEDKVMSFISSGKIPAKMVTKVASKTVNTTSKTPSNNISGLVEISFLKMDMKARLQFVEEIVRLSLSVPVPSASIVQSVQSECVESDCEEPEAPRKRLL